MGSEDADKETRGERGDGYDMQQQLKFERGMLQLCGMHHNTFVFLVPNNVVLTCTKTTIPLSTMLCHGYTDVLH